MHIFAYIKIQVFFNSHDLFIEHHRGEDGLLRDWIASRKRNNTARGIRYQRVESAQSYCAVKRLSYALNRGIWDRWAHRSGSAPGTALESRVVSRGHSSWYPLAGGARGLALYLAS